MNHHKWILWAALFFHCTPEKYQPVDPAPSRKTTCTVNKKLDEPITIDVKQMPIDEVVKKLKPLTAMSFTIIDRTGSVSYPAFDLCLKNSTLGQVLQVMTLQCPQLHCDIRNNSFVIMTLTDDIF